MMFLKAVSAGRRTYPVVTDGLKLYLDAYNTRSYPGTGTTWYDLSNSAYNLTNTGGTWTVSGGRRYFELDGVNDYITGTSNTTLYNVTSTGYTWSIWLYFVTAPVYLDSVVQDKNNGVSQAYYMDHRNNTNTNGNGWNFKTYIPISNVERGTQWNQTIVTGTWQQIVYTFTYATSTNGTFRIYHNAVQQVSTAQNTPAGRTWENANTSTYPVIGALDLNGTLVRFNNIRVGEVLQYNRPLTATEITNNYNSTKSNYGL
jgi:hypothetical protein